jgi:hypothetical protein
MSELAFFLDSFKEVRGGFVIGILADKFAADCFSDLISETVT